MKLNLLFAVAGICVLFVLSSCNSNIVAGNKNVSAVTNLYEGKKIFFIDSYHTGYNWSDGIYRGIKNVLSETDVEFEMYQMDSKRNPSAEYIENVALDVKRRIDEWQPDVVIACDDNAFRYVVMPHYKNADIPIVFCGINWDVSRYDDAPYSNTVGMIEISMIEQLYGSLKKYSGGNSVGLLSGDTYTDNKNVGYYEGLFEIDQAVLVKDVVEWKKAFVELQKSVDFLILANNQNIENWNNSDVEKFVYENVEIPIGSINIWMIPYSVLVFSTVPEEQGEYSAQTALDILDGKDLADIYIVENKKAKQHINILLSEKLNITFDPVIIKDAVLYEAEQLE